jgi:hypothetical protein
VRSTDTYTLGNKDAPFHEIDIGKQENLQHDFPSGSCLPHGMHSTSYAIAYAAWLTTRSAAVRVQHACVPLTSRILSHKPLQDFICLMCNDSFI